MTASQKSMTPSSVFGMPASAASCASSHGVLQAQSSDSQPVKSKAAPEGCEGMKPTAKKR